MGVKNMHILVNGEPGTQWDIDQSAYMGERVIKLKGPTLELTKTPDGGWKECTVAYDDNPHAGDGGHNCMGSFEHTVKHQPWVAERLWRRVVELEDELAALRKAISKKYNQ